MNQHWHQQLSATSGPRQRGTRAVDDILRGSWMASAKCILHSVVLSEGTEDHCLNRPIWLSHIITFEALDGFLQTLALWTYNMECLIFLLASKPNPISSNITTCYWRVHKICVEMDVQEMCSFCQWVTCNDTCQSHESESSFLCIFSKLQITGARHGKFLFDIINIPANCLWFLISVFH